MLQAKRRGRSCCPTPSAPRTYAAGIAAADAIAENVVALKGGPGWTNTADAAQPAASEAAAIKAAEAVFRPEDISIATAAVTVRSPHC